ncbi:MAG: polysaccharide deacetylase family protein [Gammaproteobacteria bacterium]
MVIERDFVGYAGNPPDAAWPGGAALAINFVINVEEGSERSVPDGHGASESALTELGTQKSEVFGRDLGAESMFEYGARAGVWRLLGLFREYALPCTIFGCALALERNPALAAAIAEARHDVCAHGWRWVKHFELDEAEEREQIHKAVASIRETTGERPYGWYCRYAPSENTRRLLLEEGGFLYDSDSYADDLPYWLEVGGQNHLIVPYSLTTNDVKFVRSGMSTAEQFVSFVRGGLDMLVHEGIESPKMMSVGLHPRIMGHPSRAMGLARLLEGSSTMNNVWVARRIDIARHWIAHHAPHRA